MIRTTIGRYRVDSLIGRGGMAEVYKAYQPSLNRPVAIKVMHSFLTEEKDFITRFQREAQLVANMRHPNIVQVYDFDVQEDMPYMVMEYIDGETLRDRLLRLQAQGEWLSLDEASRLILAVGSALRYAHHLGMVHRDIKPANVMIGWDGQVILTDFGIAKMLSGEGGSRLTASGAMVGTPAYMSPEQGSGQPGDARSDIYSLGVMLYELAIGRLPYEADTPLAVVIKHISEPLPMPRSVKPDLPEIYERIIVHALAKNPDERYATVDEMLADLKQAMGLMRDDTPTEYLRLSPPPKREAIPLEQTVSKPGTQPVSGPGKSMRETGPVTGRQVAQPDNRGLLATLAVLLVLLVVVGGGGGYLLWLGAKPATSPAPTLTLMPAVAPSQSPSPTLSPTPVEVRISISQDNAELREDPDGNSRLMGLLAVQTELIAHERTADNAWIRVEVRGKSGWVRTEAVDLGLFSMSRLPVAPDLIAPSPTPDLTATRAACQFLAELEQHVTMPDDAQVQAEQSFVKTWRIRNTGNCAFDEDARLVYVSGERMQSPDAVALPPVEPGQSGDVSLSLTAPALGGTYEATWELRRASGDVMGRVSLRIVVIGPTPTTPPTRAPTATRALTVTRAPTIKPAPTAIPVPTDTPPPTADVAPTPDRNLIGPVGSGDLEAGWGGNFYNCVARLDENDAWLWEADFFIDVHGGNAGYTISSGECSWDSGQQKYRCRWGARGDGTVLQTVTVNCPGCRPSSVIVQASAQIKGNTCVLK